MRTTAQLSSRQLYEEFQRELVLDGTIELLEQTIVTDPPEKRSVVMVYREFRLQKLLNTQEFPELRFIGYFLTALLR